MADHEVTREINGERVLLLSWSRAILLQFAHPLIAAGVDAHSSFQRGRFTPLIRLHHTVRAMLSLTFGDEATRARAIEKIRGIHRRINGRLPHPVGRYAAGTPYSAEDPDLVLWVHGTLLYSMLPLYERIVAPLDERVRDAYCAESAPVAVALGARAEEVPRTWAATRAYMDRMLASDAIVVGAQARTLGAVLLAPPFARTVGPATTINRLVTVGMLPPRIRGEYGFTWSARDARRLDRALSWLRVGRRWAPRLITHWSREELAGRLEPARNRHALRRETP